MKRGPAWRAKKIILLFSVAWTLLVIIAPFTIPPGSVGDLSGSVGTIDNDFEEMGAVPRAVYLLGDLNCHTIDERSFKLNGNQMPFCARDVGIFIGLCMGMVVVLLLGPRFLWPAVIILVTPLVVDGVVQLLLDYESSNMLRSITGALGGLAVALFIGHMSEVMLGPERKGETGRHRKS